MRARLHRITMCTVRPIIESDGNEFGDRPVLASATRDVAITDVPMQITYSTGIRSGDGEPGRIVVLNLLALALRRDADRLGWTPTPYDLIEIPGYDKVFLIDIQPAFPIRRSIRSAGGGFDGWRMTLSSLDPRMVAATQYDS